MLAYEFMYKLIVGPTFVIVLATILILSAKFPSYRAIAAIFLLLAGFFEVAGTLFVWRFLIALFIGLTTLVIGVFMLISDWSPINSFFSSVWARVGLKHRISLKRGLYVLLTALIVVSSLLISARTLNIIREEHQINFFMSNAPNLVVRGTVTSIALNHEVDLAYLYHVFAIYLTVNITEVVSSAGFWENESSTLESLRQYGDLTVGSDKDAGTYVIGEQIEVSGYYSRGMEDDLFSGILVVSDIINGSYIQPLP